MPRVLLIEPTQLLRRTLTRMLAADGIEVLGQGEDRGVPLTRLREEPFDVLLASWSPHVVDLVRAVRAELLLTLPVLVYSSGARSHRERATLFDAGVDQIFVLVQPDGAFEADSASELAARLHALHRRASGTVITKWTLGSLEIDVTRRAAFVDGRRIDFTSAELALVIRLAASFPNVVTKSELHAAIGYHPKTDSHALKQLVWRTRKKLGNGGPAIEAIPGIGYRIRIDSPATAAAVERGRRSGSD